MVGNLVSNANFFPILRSETETISVTELTSVATDTADVKPLSIQKQLAEIFSSLTSRPSPSSDDEKHVQALPHIQAAVDAVGKIAEEARRTEGDGDAGVDVLVTGSLHLVGGVMEVAGLAGMSTAVTDRPRKVALSTSSRSPGPSPDRLRKSRSVRDRYSWTGLPLVEATGEASTS
jgi:hypothetical protein